MSDTLARDPAGDCEPTWVQAARDLGPEPGPRIVNLPDIATYEERPGKESRSAGPGALSATVGLGVVPSGNTKRR